MANRLKMAQQNTILALAQRGWSYRRIALELGVHRGTVSLHVRRAAAAGLGPGLPADANPAISIAGLDGPADDDPDATPPRRFQTQPFRIPGRPVGAAAVNRCGRSSWPSWSRDLRPSGSGRI
ncbi:MAG: helix-turn-helix domain-containing protein [Vicinamibacterales bacterium]